MVEQVRTLKVSYIIPKLKLIFGARYTARGRRLGLRHEDPLCDLS